MIGTKTSLNWKDNPFSVGVEEHICVSTGDCELEIELEDYFRSDLTIGSHYIYKYKTNRSKYFTAVVLVSHTAGEKIRVPVQRVSEWSDYANNTKCIVVWTDKIRISYSVSLSVIVEVTQCQY